MCPMIKKLYGNLFDSRMETLVNTVNCVGVMSKGIALQFKLRYPEMFHDYKAKCAAGSLLPGEPYLYRDTTGKSILNFPTRRHWRDDSRIVDIESGLDCFVQHYREWGIVSIAFPPLGSDGGLPWAQVENLMTEKLSVITIPIEIYMPYLQRNIH